jgi:hypothetical protein
MRIFQNFGLYPAYKARLRTLTSEERSFNEQIGAFLDDRFGAPHFLEPVLARDPMAFFANGDEPVSQRRWAREQGMPGRSSLESILLAQIEAHRTEVFYNVDPIRYSPEFVRRLPGCVRKSIAWRAAPSQGADFSAYDLVVCNAPTVLQAYRDRGWKAAYFAPAHDPVLEEYASNDDRPIDVLFVGGYSRHHARRALTLETIARLHDRFSIVFHLDRSRLTRLAESVLGRLLPLKTHRRPSAIHAVSQPGVFGRDLYAMLSRAKIVLNGAIDMAGPDRGNMRCFETLGSRSLLLSDAGRYPEGMVDDLTIRTYRSADEAAASIVHLLREPQQARRIADAGYRMVRTRYSKKMQWAEFVELAQ